jgi:hypothetical protein
MSNDFLGLIRLKLSDVLAKGVSGGWYRLRDKKAEKPTHGRIFMVFVADKTLAPGRVRTPLERQNILYWATQKVVNTMDHHQDPAASLAALALSPSVASTPAHFPTPAASASAASASASPSADQIFSTPLPCQSSLKVFVATWNVGNAPPDTIEKDGWAEWIQPGHDVYAIGQ